MVRRRRRKCLHCRALFELDRRNLRHQRYCSQPACRKASQAASQRRWLSKPENRDYFCGRANVRRVQAWRGAHPGYWRRGSRLGAAPLQEDCAAQGIEREGKSGEFARSPLQELLPGQPLVLIGLIAQLTGSALQDEIAETTRRLIGLGGHILNPQGGCYDDQMGLMPGTGPPDPRSVQLGGSPPGPP